MWQYDMIHKRKSFHLFRGIERPLTDEEIEEINTALGACKPLVGGIKVATKIVPANETTCRRGETHCILFYSEKKEGYLENIGYIGEQIDLYLASRDIGALWYGIGKPKEKNHSGLEYVIMIAFAKMPPKTFRKDMIKAKRNMLAEIREGEGFDEILNIARFSPSACNSQPWYVSCEKKTLSVYRYIRKGKRGIMPEGSVSYYNQIDIGIFLYILELCMEHGGLVCTRSLMFEHSDLEKNLTAQYEITT
ncbi:MAG: nitroreductase family protein [Sphaerochaetaceae bacterium]|nr:nitroreductase family protein [Sphaerochaetaceae bacterium]